MCSIPSTAKQSHEELSMPASGTFEVKLDPQNDELTPVGRMLIDKQYTGDLVGVGKGQMISKRTDAGVAVYYAIEEFEGSVNGKTGTFTLVHEGYMSPQQQNLHIKILEGTGQGELTGISGTLDITQENSIHSYKLTYDL